MGLGLHPGQELDPRNAAGHYHGRAGGALEGWFCQLGVGTETVRAHTLCCVLSVGNLPPQPAQFLELSA
jgi:hypothetical protein